jgi:universal stress protein E
MVDTTKVFVVLDPTSMDQPSLVWGEKIALDMKQQRSLTVQLHVYCCIDPTEGTVTAEGTAEPRMVVESMGEWMERIVMHTRALGIPVETEVESDTEWRQAIVNAAKRVQSNVVIKNLTQHSRLVRLVRETADWQLLRDCHCPVLLVKAGKAYGIKKILVAVKFTEDETYRSANTSLLDAAKRLADDLGATVHAVTCYQSNEHPDRQRFADSCGLERSQVTAATGTPEKVIASVANEVDADLLVIARVARPESVGMLGDTARKVIDEIATDVLVLPMAG